MFTGIIEELGEVVEVVKKSDSIQLSVRGRLATTDVELGDSIAVNGCCLTVATAADDTFVTDVMAETLDKTSLGGLVVGMRVNLERAVTPTTRLGGHVVQGHVDARGEVRRRQPSENWEIVEIAFPSQLARYLVPKGSVTVDGVSLTLVEVGDDSFTVSLIPETLSRTTLGARQPGDQVNLEVDVLGKYVERLLAFTNKENS